MLKVSKPSHKLHKSSRVSPMRKEHLMKKSMHSSSSMRVSGASRPSTMKHLSPGMKRTPIMPPSKSMHSPRLRSIASSPHRSLPRHTLQDSPVSMDRGRPPKTSKYEKRKHTPPSPIRHPMASSSTALDIRGSSPYQDDRYLGGRAVVREPHFSSPPLKKKTRREPERYERSGSPGLRMMHRPEVSLHSGGRMPPHRNEMPPRSSPIPSISNPVQHRSHMSSSVHDGRSDHFDVHNRARPGPLPVMSSNHSKRPQLKTSYDNQRPERYRSPSPVERYPTLVSKEKRYAPTLHERFSTVVEAARTEPRIKYSREDLEKITIDIHRNIKTPSPTLRHIVNPNDVKLVRRANEGHRPMFDREEIKQAPRDMREDAYYEKKTTSDGAYSSMNSINLRDADNYEITRHRFDPHPVAFHSTSGRSLSDRWQSAEGRKDNTALDRDHREYERQPAKRRFVDTRSKSGDQDFRSEKYADEPSRERPDYHSSQLRMSSPAERRGSMPIHRKENSIQDARQRLNIRRGSDREPPPVMHSDSRSRYPSQSDKHYPDGLSTRVEKHYSDRRSPVSETHKWMPKHRSESRERLPEFARRPDKYSHKSWPEKQDLSPRGSNYFFEPEGRVELEPYRGRGSSRPFRSSRGLRSRDFRGGSRGGFPTRSSYRGGYRSSINMRGRGAPRRGRFSPGVWEHDLYSRSSEDHKLDLP